MEKEEKNEVLTKDKSQIIPMKNNYNICKSAIKIEYNDIKASGFFITFHRKDNPFYCIMTNEHVFEPEKIKDMDKIEIKYDNENKSFIILYNKKERIIQYFKELLNIDLVIIEVIEKDNIKDEYFSIPNFNYNDGYNQFFGKEIKIAQYPGGKEIAVSEGIISNKNLDNKYKFYHTADTKFGSSGSPIYLKGDNTIIGIHSAGNKIERINCGYFIGPAIDYMKMKFKRNGEGIEYYKNGNIKYEGYFFDDKYDGGGIYYYENGDRYCGEFKNGKQNGEGCIIYKDGSKTTKGKFLDDKLISKEEAETNKDSESENDDSNDNKEDSDNNDDKKDNNKDGSENNDDKRHNHNSSLDKNDNLDKDEEDDNKDYKNDNSDLEDDSDDYKKENNNGDSDKNEDSFINDDSDDDRKDNKNDNSEKNNDSEENKDSDNSDDTDNNNNDDKKHYGYYNNNTNKKKIIIRKKKNNNKKKNI